MEHKEFDLITFGEIMLRLSPSVNELISKSDSFKKHAGGAELNVASGVSLLGLRTGIITRLPKNQLGTFIKNRIRASSVSDDYIIFRPGSKFYVNSTAGHGIKANDGIDIRGSVVNVEVSRTSAKGIKSEGYVNISGGRTTIITIGQSIVEGNDTSSCAAVKCDSTFTITGGTLRMKSTGIGGKAINATKDITISGGDVAAVTLGEKGVGAPKAIKSDEDIVINGGKTYSYSAYSKPLDADGILTIGTGWKTYKTTDRAVIIEY